MNLKRLYEHAKSHTEKTHVFCSCKVSGTQQNNLRLGLILKSHRLQVTSSNFISTVLFDYLLRKKKNVDKVRALDFTRENKIVARIFSCGILYEDFKASY